MRLILLLFISITSATLYAQIIDLEVEPNHSTIGFRVSISGFTEITGKFTDYSLELAHHNEDFTQSKITADVKAASINTGIAERDQHLRTADFFDVEKFPNISFTTDSIQQVNFANFIAFGQFSMHGITRSIQLPITIIKKEGNTIGIKIRTSINRLDYGVGESFAHDSMNDFLAKEIQIEIDFWTRKKKKK